MPPNPTCQLDAACPESTGVRAMRVVTVARAICLTPSRELCSTACPSDRIRLLKLVKLTLVDGLVIFDSWWLRLLRLRRFQEGRVHCLHVMMHDISIRPKHFDPIAVLLDIHPGESSRATKARDSTSIEAVKCQLIQLESRPEFRSVGYTFRERSPVYAALLLYELNLILVLL